MEPKNILHNRWREVLVDIMDWETLFLLGSATHHPNLTRLISGEVNEQEQDICVTTLHNYTFIPFTYGFKGMEDDPCVSLLVVSFLIEYDRILIEYDVDPGHHATELLHQSLLEDIGILTKRLAVRWLTKYLYQCVTIYYDACFSFGLWCFIDLLYTKTFR